MADLLDVATVARYLGIDDYASVEDQLDEMIDGAQAVIERIMWRSIMARTDRTEYYDARGLSLYTLQAPISTIYALTDDAQGSERVISLVNVIQSTDDGGRNYAGGKVELWKGEGGFSGNRAGVRIWYSAGWTATTLPADLKQAWIELVMHWFNNQARIGIIQAGMSGESTAWDKREVPEELMPVFMAYRLWGGG